MTFIYFYDFPFSWEWKIIPTDELTNSYIFQRGSSTINQDFIFVDTTSGGPAIDLTNLPENVRYVHRDNTGFLVSGGRVRCFRTVFPKENSLRLGNPFEGPMCGTDLGMGQNLVPLVNIKIAGKWMFIPLKLILIGFDPSPCLVVISLCSRWSHSESQASSWASTRWSRRRGDLGAMATTINWDVGPL